MPSPANGQESNKTETVKMLKTLTAIGISAAIVFAPLAAIAQTDAAPAGAPAASDTAAPAADAMKKTPKKHTAKKKHMAKKTKAPAADDAAPAAPADAPKS
jgi:hypothetical protein